MRIAIVNDHLRTIDVLQRLVMSKAGYEIAWTATDGAAAVEKCRDDLPDLILMDLIMPVMDGVEASCRIMGETPCAILLVTTTVSGHSDKVFEAMGCGALDVVRTPVMDANDQVEGGKELLTKMDRISRLIQKPSIKSSKSQAVERRTINDGLPSLVAMGASAGGPKAVAQILGRLPKNFGGAIIIVQHVDAGFAVSLVEWLKSQTSLGVELARSGAMPAAGKVLVAGGDRHLVMTQQLKLSYTDEPRESSYRPSIDVFFSSAAKYWPRKALGILLTGMGRDGAQGLLCLRQAGWQTIAQDKATCVVYGMPKAAVELDAAGAVLPLSEIPVAMSGFALRR